MQIKHIQATHIQNERTNPTKQRFAEELEVLRSKYGDVDQDALVVKLLVEEFSFTTVEADDLPTLKTQPRDKDKVYLLGETNFRQRPPSACVELTSLKPKVTANKGRERDPLLRS